jgi:D-alanyl-lipoteichoic acid acyltransferase DltB (MBOAT superfamily)
MWLRDFLFFPIGKRLPRGAAPVIAPLLVMSLCGLWHGLTIPFLIWGAMHGAGLAIHQLWLRARRASGALDAAAGSIAGRTVFAVVTILYVCISWVFFSAADLSVASQNLRELAAQAAPSIAMIGYASAVIAAWSFVPGVRDAIRRLAASPDPGIASHMARLWRVHLDIVCLLIVLARSLLSRAQPEGAFVYQGF